MLPWLNASHASVFSCCIYFSVCCCCSYACWTVSNYSLLEECSKMSHFLQIHICSTVWFYWLFFLVVWLLDKLHTDLCGGCCKLDSHWHFFSEFFLLPCLQDLLLLSTFSVERTLVHIRWEFFFHVQLCSTEIPDGRLVCGCFTGKYKVCANSDGCCSLTCSNGYPEWQS